MTVKGSTLAWLAACGLSAYLATWRERYKWAIAQAAQQEIALQVVAEHGIDEMSAWLSDENPN